jgi:hypothetical protein
MTNVRVLRRLRVEGAILYIIALACFFAVLLPDILRATGFVFSFVGLLVFLQSGFQIEDLLSEDKRTITRRARAIKMERENAMEV